MTRLRHEDGWALVTALLLMIIMMGFGLSTLALVDTQQDVSADGRQRETAFNVAEAALNAQTYALARSWAGQGGAGNTQIRQPASCTQASVDARCPTAATLASLYSSPDTMPTASWTTNVRDNSGSAGAESFWSESMITTAPTYDANGDGRLWVRSSSVVDGESRAMVALIRTEPQYEDLPRVTLLAGRFSIGNMGNKELIDTLGPSASTGPVQVRCTPGLLDTTPCLGHRIAGGLGSLAELVALLDVQISPNVSVTGSTAGDALSADALVRLKAAATANGTYYSSCPSSLAGSVVYIETTAACNYQGNVTYNSDTAPGAIIMTGGSLTIAGNVKYHGVVYHANVSDSTATVVTITGAGRVQGGVVIDGLATLSAGNSGNAQVNIVFDDRVYSRLASYGGAGLVQNTWREIR